MAQTDTQASFLSQVLYLPLSSKPWVSLETLGSYAPTCPPWSPPSLAAWRSWSGGGMGLIDKIRYSAFRKYSDPYTSSKFCCGKKLKLHLHQYSDPLLSTLLKHLWQRWQHGVFLGMTLGTPVFGEFQPFFSADPLQLYQGGWGALLHSYFQSLQRCSIWFKFGLWLGHSRTFRELSQSPSCVVLAVCLGSLSC